MAIALYLSDVKDKAVLAVPYLEAAPIRQGGYAVGVVGFHELAHLRDVGQNCLHRFAVGHSCRHLLVHNARHGDGIGRFHFDVLDGVIIVVKAEVCVFVANDQDGIAMHQNNRILYAGSVDTLISLDVVAAGIDNH